MFKIKRPAIVGLLVVLLLFISFLNYQLTQQSILKASKNYQEFETGQMENMERNVFSENFEIEDSEEDDVAQKDVNDQDVDKGDNSVDNVISTRKNEIEGVIDQEVENYFVNFRLSRDKIRAESIERLDEIINNEMTEQTIRTEAQEEVLNIGRISEQEMQIEGLIKSKGFKEALVFLTSEDIKIVVDTDELDQQEMVKILDIVKSETDIEMDNIKIMKKQ